MKKDNDIAEKLVEQEVMVIAIDKMEYPEKDCAKIFNNYYLKGKVGVKDSGHAYYIKNRWRTNVVWDHSFGKYVDPTDGPDLVYCIVDENGTKGFASPIGEMTTYMGETYLTSKLLPKDIPSVPILPLNSMWDENTKHPITENFNASSNYSSLQNKKCSTLADKAIKPCSKAFYHFRPKLKSLKNYHEHIFRTGQVYSLADMNFNIKKKLHEEFTQKLAKTPNIFKELSKHIPYSIGLEFETSTGTIPNPVCVDAGLIPLKDGSIQGMEYTTIPFKGPQVVDSIVRACLALVNYTTVNHNCSLHVHFGGLPKDRLFILSLFKVWHEIEEEIGCLNVINKRSHKFIKQKLNPNKDHCQPLPDLNFPRVLTKEKISEMYAKMISVVNAGHRPDGEFNVKGKKHIYDNGAKWNIKGRYYSMNIMNYLYGKSETVEFRLHAGTVNPHKTLNYVLILNAIIKYCVKHGNEIFNPYNRASLKGILHSIYGNSYLFTYLYDYIEERKNAFFNEYVTNSNSDDGQYIFESRVFDEDNIYEFSSGGINILNVPGCLEHLGPHKEALPFGPKERFPFTWVTGQLPEDVNEEFLEKHPLGFNFESPDFAFGNYVINEYKINWDPAEKFKAQNGPPLPPDFFKEDEEYDDDEDEYDEDEYDEEDLEEDEDVMEEEAPLLVDGEGDFHIG